MLSAARIWTLFRARTTAARTVGEGAAALIFQGVFTAGFCALVRSELPPYPYAVFFLGLLVALIGIPLLGELGHLLRRDPAQDWVEALAIRPMEVQLARTAELLWILGAQAFACGLPAALLAPPETELLGRLALPLLAVGEACALAAFLLCAQSLLGGRAEGLFVLLQTFLVGGVCLGSIVGLRELDTLARLPVVGDPYAPFLWGLPPAWFAAPLAGSDVGLVGLLPVGVTLAALLVLALLPRPAPLRRVASGRPPLLERLLGPARRVAERFWVRPRERGGFLLVYEGLPREREVVLRTYPMLGIPLAFAALGAVAEGEPEKARELMAILLFTVAIYLPVLLTHVPATESPAASWLHATAPVREEELHAGAQKALAVRFLLPLYGVLAVLTWALADLGTCAKLVPPAFLTSLLVLRRLYPACVHGPPMSVPPNEIEAGSDWMSLLAGAALLLTVAAVAVHRFLDGAGTVILCTALLGLEVLGEQRARRGAENPVTTPRSLD